jgi:hypothetical protein
LQKSTIPAAGVTMSPYQNTYTASHAIVVGIDDYAEPKFKPLGKAEADARDVARVLAAKPYSFSVRTLLGGKATKAAIIGALRDLRTATRPDDRVVFYFAGHGYKLSDNLGNEVGYLACSDTVSGDPYAGLEFDEVTKVRRWAKAKHIAFILDACFGGKALGLTRGISGAAADKYMTRRAWQVLTAGGDEVVADAHSMTDILVRALREGVPGTEGPLTFSAAGDFVKDEMAARSYGMQIPVCQYLVGSSNGEMILRPPSPAAGAVTPEPEPPATRAAAPEAPARITRIPAEEPLQAEPVEPPMYDVFVSYAPLDGGSIVGFGARLLTDLRQRGFRVFSDVSSKSKISSADDPQSFTIWRIRADIEECTVFILVASSATWASDYVKLTIDYAKRYDKPVIVLRRGSTSPAEMEALKSGLRVVHEMYLDKDSMDYDKKLETLVGWLREWIPR